MSEFRRRLLMQSKSELPSGYTLLAYIESNGLQMLDTLIIAENTYWEMKVKGVKVTPSMQVFFGRGYAGGLAIGQMNNTTAYSIITQSTDSLVLSHTSYTDIAHITADYTQKLFVVSVNDEIISAVKKTSTVPQILLFNNLKKTTPAYARLYSIMAFDIANNVLFNGIPAIDSNSNVGLFDTITQQLFQSTTTTQFIAGYE